MATKQNEWVGLTGSHLIGVGNLGRRYFLWIVLKKSILAQPNYLSINYQNISLPNQCRSAALAGPGKSELQAGLSIGVKLN